MKQLTMTSILFDIASKARCVEHSKQHGIPVNRKEMIDDTTSILRSAGIKITDEAVETILFNGKS